MKNSIKIIALFVASLLGSCDLLENPKGLLSPVGFFKTTTDVEAAIAGTYGKMASDYAWGGETQQALMLLGDMIDVGQAGAAVQNFEINNFALTPTNYYAKTIWWKLYDIIGSANNAILAAQLIDAKEDVKLTLEAESRVVRAYMYFNLVQLYGSIPYLDKVVSDPSSVSTMSKTSEADVYTNIIADLEFGKAHLPMKFSNNVRTRATAGTAATILASVQLTLGNWQKAYDNAKWVIDKAGDLGYSLVPNYQDLFDATKQNGISEHIFAVDFLGGLRGTDNFDLIPALTGGNFTGGWSIIIPSMAVYNNWDPRDYRKKVSFADTITVNNVAHPYTEFFVPRPYCAKYWRYPGVSGSGKTLSDNNYPLYRYAEVLLIAAESLNEISGPITEAKGYVNKVRERARIWPNLVSNFPANVEANISSKDQFRDLVLEERRLELAFEYKRWFDIKRRHLGDQVFKGPNSLEPHANFDSNKHYLLPIPQTELDINPNLVPQNPGY